MFVLTAKEALSHSLGLSEQNESPHTRSCTSTHTYVTPTERETRFPGETPPSDPLALWFQAFSLATLRMEVAAVKESKLISLWSELGDA